MTRSSSSAQFDDREMLAACCEADMRIKSRTAPTANLLSEAAVLGFQPDSGVDAVGGDAAGEGNGEVSQRDHVDDGGSDSFRPAASLPIGMKPEPGWPLRGSFSRFAAARAR